MQAKLKMFVTSLLHLNHTDRRLSASHTRIYAVGNGLKHNNKGNNHQRQLPLINSVSLFLHNITFYLIPLEMAYCLPVYEALMFYLI